MNLYEISVEDTPAVHVVARNPAQAVDVFITFEAARGRVHQSLAVKPIPVTDLDPEPESKVLYPLVLGAAGVLHHDEDLGWVFSPPLCTASDSGDLLVRAVDGGAW